MNNSNNAINAQKLNPFHAVPDEGRTQSTVFITPAWQGQIELVTHLCQYSQNVLLVIAPLGGGKTTYLSHLSTLLPVGTRQQILRADPALSSANWLNLIAEGFDVPSQGIEGTIFNIHTALEEAYDFNQAIWTLFVDDAHLLTNAQLQILLELVKFDVEPSKQLHLVLLGEPSLELRLFSPELADYVQGKLYTVELESWTLLDVKTYFAKDDYLSPLTPEQIQTIFEKSRGLPGCVIREKNTLLKQSQTHQKYDWLAFKKHAFRPVAIGIVLGAVIGGTYLMTHSGMNASAMEEEDLLATTSIELPDDPWTQRPTLPAAEAVDAGSADVADVADAVTMRFDEEAAAKVITPSIQPIAQASQPLKKSIDVPKPPASAGKLYTLQLLGSRKEENVKKFIALYGLQNKAKYFRTRRAGQDWFVVVYGEYPSSTAAKAAIPEMPKSLKQAALQPWVRELQGLREDLSQQG